MEGKGAEQRSRILRKQKEWEPKLERGGGLPAPTAICEDRADGAPFGAGWEARKFPPGVPPLRVKWEAGSCVLRGKGKAEEERKV